MDYVEVELEETENIINDLEYMTREFPERKKWKNELEKEKNLASAMRIRKEQLERRNR